jgi:hypothetical protein
VAACTLQGTAAGMSDEDAAILGGMVLNPSGTTPGGMPGSAGGGGRRNGGITNGVGASAGVGITSEQQKNITRFEKKLPANAKDNVTTMELPNGGIAAQATSPGRVPGSSAVYEKQIDAAGNTIQYTKTTYGPDGSIVHVKDKITGGVIP